MRLVQGGITAAKGFSASGIHCGIKYRNKDLALIYSRVPCAACGVFTRNKVQAAPVKVAQAHLRNSRAQAVVINSGNANCCTGRQGISDARSICRVVAKSLGINIKDVLAASTGIIGKRLPLEKIKKAIRHLVDSLSPQAGLAAAEAIMTTDTLPKEISVEVKIGKVAVRIGGMAKGAGMIEPHLATMLGFISTDAAIDKKRLKKALREAVAHSFNSITVEGDTSTNDTVLILANGLAGNKNFSPEEFKIFQKALNFVCLSLAKMIIKDAEGASKFVEIYVEGARNTVQARKVAFKVANSALVKTALFGQNPNWGRIAASAGSADNAVRAQSLDIYLGAIKVLGKGLALKVNQQKLNNLFKKGHIQIRLKLGLGKFTARVFTCDLSHKYVDINAKYQENCLRQ